MNCGQFSVFQLVPYCICTRITLRESLALLNADDFPRAACSMLCYKGFVFVVQAAFCIEVYSFLMIRWYFYEAIYFV